MLRNERSDWSSYSTAGTRVLAVSADDERSLLLRASLHLIEVEVDETPSIDQGCQLLDHTSPGLVVLDAAVPGSAAARERLARKAARCGAPVLALATATDPVACADLTLFPDINPHDILGAVSSLAANLYQQEPQAVQVCPEEQLLLQTHDLHRLVEAQQAERLEFQHRSAQQTARGLLDVLALRDIETFEHSLRVASYARTLSVAVAPELLTDPSTELGFLLHDIGKLGIPDRILLHPGPLTAQHLKRMQEHAVLGAQVASSLLPPDTAGAAVIHHHHEHWDGTGYPDGLKGLEIPLCARIFAVADALDALTSDRPYRRANTWEHALITISNDAGSHFDPTVVAALLQERHAFRALTALP
ncbi:MAG: HD-GYP domain-containing protein [Actinobacteria bacterium]|nr:HD-GYP domain-containing protein [Actinomycetota bacterium]